jgi:hypothetical protein
MSEGAKNSAGRYASHPPRFLGGRFAVEPSWTGWRAARGNLRAPALCLHLAGDIRRDDLGRCQICGQIPFI